MQKNKFSHTATPLNNMGKRLITTDGHTTVGSIRKRKRVGNESGQEEKNGRKWEEGDHSSENSRNTSHRPNLNVSIEDNNSPKPVYHLRPNAVNGIILEDLTQKQWRIGKPIGKGNFGEIFLASDNIYAPVTNENAKYVVKIEPHSNGPLFVEIHCLLNAAKNCPESPLPPGMPEYIASGSHYFGDARYRFLVLKRFDRDLHSLIKNRRVSQKLVLTLALQIIQVLQHLHDKGYCHNDIKAQNLMISKCTIRRSPVVSSSNCRENNGNNHNGDECSDDSEDESNNSDSGNSSNQDEDDEEEDDDEDDEQEPDMFRTPINKRRRNKTIVQYSGSNPVRSCRRDKRNSIYDEMVKSHYLRPTKRISYSEFFNEDNSKDGDDAACSFHDAQHNTTTTTMMNRRSRNTSRQHVSLNVKQKTKKRASSSSSSESSKTSDDSEDEDDDNDNMVTEERVFLIDFGLASKFIDNGVHRPFVMDQRRAHDGTLEFTSRDAHMGAHSRRSDLECLGYNLLFWSQGYLPWKDAAAQHQNERVHWIKEYLMKDVKEMLKHIYGKQVPKYLGEYLQYVGQLAYHERPDYEKCRRIFEREYVSLGYDLDKMQLSTEELIRTSVKVKEEIENNNILEMKNIKSIMKNLNVIMPFHESTLSNRVSPKNLRSKSAKKKSLRKKFSWTEILSQDPDQIARERAEKEFDREPSSETPVRRYEGKPTYAIIEIQSRLKLKDRIDAYRTDEEDTDNDGVAEEEAEEIVHENRKSATVKKELLAPINDVTRHSSSSRTTRTKAGLKTFINATPTTIGTAGSQVNPNSTAKRAPHHHHRMHLSDTTTTVTSIGEKQQRRTRRCLIKTGSTGDFTTSDESSCSSIISNGISLDNPHRSTMNGKKTKVSLNGVVIGRRNKMSRSDRSSSTEPSSNNYSAVTSEEDDTSHYCDNSILFGAKRTRNLTEKLKLKTDNKHDSSSILLNSEGVIGAKRRKRSIPKKRKSSTKDDCYEGEMLDERDLRTFKKRACRG